MNSKRELAWWFEFGQIDFNNYRKTTKENWKRTFKKKIQRYQQKGFLNFDYLDRTANIDFAKTKKRTEIAVNEIKKVVREGHDLYGDEFLNGQVTLETNTSYVGGKFKQQVMSEGFPEAVVFLAFGNLLRNVEGGTFKECKFDQCDNMFFPYSGIGKEYCSSRCSTIAAQKRNKE